MSLISGRATMLLSAAVVTVSAVACSSSAAVPRGSVASCAQFGADAIRRHVTVTAVPAACRGLSQVEVNVAVGRALRAAAAGVHGKAGQRRLISRDSQYLSGLVRAVPVASPAASPAVTASVTSPAAAPVSAPPSRGTLALAALATWLVTAGLGMSMMARWITRPGPPRGRRVRGRRTPALNYAHLGLAVAGLLAWIGYLATGVTGLAWAACGLLLPVAGLGMTLVFLVPARDADAAPASAGQAAAALTSSGAPAPRSAVLVLAAHVTAASATILLAVLAAIGSG